MPFKGNYFLIYCLLMKNYVKNSYFMLFYVVTTFDGPIVSTDTTSIEITVRVPTRYEMYPKELIIMGVRCLRASFNFF